mgnify:CR=1 FL=1
MSRIVKIVLGSGFVCVSLFALTGCSGTTSTNEAPKIEGVSVGDYRDQQEVAAQKASSKRTAKSSAKKSH